MHHQVEAAIGAAGILNGASHTEVIVDDGRCTVIEIGARPAPGHIGLLTQYASASTCGRRCSRSPSAARPSSPPASADTPPCGS